MGVTFSLRQKRDLCTVRLWLTAAYAAALVVAGLITFSAIEVRIARRVSQPNICRVYDIGELEGRHFLTMEYIDGEDLSSLLKRIGSLRGPVARRPSADAL
jgi:hypothetical protein